MENTFETNSDSINLTGSISVQIYYEDTDLSGFVYHSNYLKYFERAREHLIGVKRLLKWADDGFHFVVAHADISYLFPARLGDQLQIKSSAEISRSPVTMYYQEAWREHTLITKATIKLVTLNHQNKPARTPPEIIAELGQI